MVNGIKLPDWVNMMRGSVISFLNTTILVATLSWAIISGGFGLKGRLETLEMTNLRTRQVEEKHLVNQERTIEELYQIRVLLAVQTEQIKELNRRVNKIEEKVR